MPSLFGIDIAGIIGDNLGPGLLPATLIKVTPGTRTPGSLTGGANATTASYSARGILVEYDDKEIDGTLVVKGDKQVLLLGATIASSKIPVPGDSVTIEGYTYNIIKVSRDPAAATYSCQVRGAPYA